MGGIDVHAHLAPRLPVKGALPGPSNLYEPAALVDWLRQRGLVAAAVSVPPPFYRQQLDADEARTWVRSLNDGLCELLAPYPQLVPLGYLPMEHPDVARAELDRLHGDHRWGGFTGAAGGRSVLDAPDLAKVWRGLEENSSALLLHPGHSPDRRLEAYYLANLLGNPVETGVALAQLLFGDVLGRHPALKVALVHCGGVVTAVTGRWRQGIETARPGVEPLSRDMAEALHGVWVDNLAHDAALIDLAISCFGRDRMVLGSDWPFPMGNDDPQSAVAHLDDELAAAITEANALDLLGGREVWRKVVGSA
ncbi:amidohydrolase family protein [Actinomadura sp. 3N407]|uniref:amidohydrolase family protein n=1 Tax=Actinomadura sp. 3N407 TaxID=3457423 RepID=UPI003FCCA96F